MEKKYQIIYADPPWDYNNTNNLEGQFWGIAERHYPVMRFSDIKQLPIASLADNDCYLFLWVTAPFMQKSFDIIQSWGFQYSTIAFVWIKMKNDMSGIRGDGLGKFTISNAEFCLLSRKGRYFRVSKNVKQIVQSPRLAHSQKPAEIRDRIVKLCGDLPRIELFARQKVKGWDSWGNEVESDIDLLALEL